MVIDVSVTDQLIGHQNDTYAHSSVRIWHLDPATNFSWSADEFLLFGHPMEWALKGAVGGPTFADRVIHLTFAACIHVFLTSPLMWHK